MGIVNEEPLTPKDRLYRIVENAMCIGCGLCQSIAGDDSIRVVKVESGYLCPVVVGEIDHACVDRIYHCCPGTRLEGLPEHLVESDTRTDIVWGPWRQMVPAWAADPKVRHAGSTGGVLTALATYLLSSGRVDFILHVRASESEPSFGERHLSFTHADVMAAAGSRYGPTAPLIDISDVLDRGQPFAFIGKPCDLSALRNFAEIDPRVNELVKYWLTPVCGGFMPPQGLKAFYDRMNIDEKAVTAVRYRGYGCPGPTRIETSNGAVEADYVDFWGESESMWVLPFRCKVCPDGIGETADIAAADSWSGGTPERDASDKDPGENAIVVRTKAGQELLNAAVRDGALAVGEDLTPEDMNRFQPHQKQKKYAVLSRFTGLQEEGRLTPTTRRLRLKELADAMTDEFNTRQREGARDRVRIGKADEPTPRVPENVDS